jgi:DNA invertase Pin-like site-specific DNA recombinase
MIYGYARVSTIGQTLEAQVEALKAAGCNKTFRETATGKNAERPQLKALIAKLQPGDLVLTTFLDRLSRDVTDTFVIVRQIEQAGAHYKSLGEPAADTTSPFKEVFIAVMGIAASMQRKRIIENTTAGRLRATQRGQHMGRPPTLTPAQTAEARRRKAEGATIGELAASYNVSKSTISRLSRQNAA